MYRRGAQNDKHNDKIRVFSKMYVKIRLATVLPAIKDTQQAPEKARIL